MRPNERGAALILALFALAVLLPLALILSHLILLRQRQVHAFREDVSGTLAVRAGLDLALSGLREGTIDPAEDSEHAFESEDVGWRAIDVRVIRQADVIVTQAGDVTAPLPTGDVDAAPSGDGPYPPGVHVVPAVPSDPRSFRVYVWDPLAPGAQAALVVPPYRRLAVYVVESKTRKHPLLPETRLLAVVVRTPEGRVSCVGRRYDRGYF